MKYFKSLLVFALSILFLGCTQFSRPVEVTPTPNVDEEYTVYSALIEDLFIRHPRELVDTPSSIIVIREQTGLYDNQELIALDLQSLDQRPGVEAETAEDFKTKNSSSHKLRAAFNLSLPYFLLSPQEFDAVHGVFGLRKKYPGAQGIMTLSRVGFNANRTQAFVYVGNQVASLAGAGYYVILGKVNGIWEIQKEDVIWIS